MMWLYVVIFVVLVGHLFWRMGDMQPTVVEYSTFLEHIESGYVEEIVLVNRVPVFKTQIPELEEGTLVFVINKEHQKHLEPGKVVARSHKHYRIEFNDKSKIWMPQHWIEAIPKDML